MFGHGEADGTADGAVMATPRSVLAARALAGLQVVGALVAGALVASSSAGLSAVVFAVALVIAVPLLLVRRGRPSVRTALVVVEAVLALPLLLAAAFVLILGIPLMATCAGVIVLLSTPSAQAFSSAATPAT